MKYKVYDESGKLIHEGQTKAKKKESEFSAKAGFGTHINKKYGNCCKLVILTCTKEFDVGKFGDIFKNFGNMFGGSNR